MLWKKDVKRLSAASGGHDGAIKSAEAEVAMLAGSLETAREEVEQHEEKLSAANAGLEEITEALVNHLKRQPNVRLHTGTSVRSVAFDQSSAEFKVIEWYLIHHHTADV